MSKISSQELNTDLRNKINKIDNIEQDVMSHKAESALKHITESGSNTNGKYIKFDDGTMICISPTIALTYSSGNVLQKGWTFPATFTDDTYYIKPSVSLPPSGKRESLFQDALKTATSATIRLASNNTSLFVSGDTVNSQSFAIGRWK